MFAFATQVISKSGTLAIFRTVKQVDAKIALSNNQQVSLKVFLLGWMQAHMVFTTAVAWAPDSKCVVSVSGDGSACLTQGISPPRLCEQVQVQVGMEISHETARKSAPDFRQVTVSLHASIMPSNPRDCYHGAGVDF